MTTIIQPTAFSLMPVLGVYPQPRGTAGSTVAGTYHDLTTEVTTLSSSWSEYLFEVADAFGTPDMVAESLTPSVSSVVNFPLVERVSSGIAHIKLTYGNASTTRTLDMRTAGGSQSLAVTGFGAGTVGDHSWGIIEPMLIAGGDDNLLQGGTGADFGAATYNAGCWAAGFDFSGVSHKQSATNNSRYVGTNITARHKLFANHYAPAIGTVMTDIAPDGTKHQRSIVAYNTGALVSTYNANPVVGDIAVALMSADAHGDLAIYPIVGPWIYEATVDGAGFPGYVQGWVGVKLDQYRRVLLAGRTDTQPSTSYLVSGTYEGVTVADAFAWHATDWGPSQYLPDFLSAHESRYEDSITGDSGTPRFYPISDTQLALAGCVTTSVGGGPFVNEEILNACIASASANGGYGTTLTVTVAPDPTS